MLLQNTILQQPSTSTKSENNLEVKSPNIIAMDVIGSMLSVPVDALRMARSWVCTALYSVQKCPEVNGVIFHDWKIITGGMNSGSFEPITGSVNFDVYS